MSFGGCVSYLTEKKGAEVLVAEGVRSDSAQHMTDDFNRVRNLNPDLNKSVWHVSVSFAPEDKGKITEELMKAISKDYVDKFGLEQYAVIRHTDAKHEHFHLVGNRVKYDGKTVSDQFCAARGAELSNKLEVKYELTHAKEKGKRLEFTHQDKLKGNDKVKYEIYQAIDKELPGAKSMEELKEKLKGYGISTELKIQSCFKGSEVDKGFGINNIQKVIESTLKGILEKSIPGLKEIGKVAGILKKGIDMGMDM